MNWSAVSAVAAVIGVMVCVIGVLGGFIVRMHVDKAKLEARVESLERADDQKGSLIGKLFDRVDEIRGGMARLEEGVKTLIAGSHRP